MPRKPKPRPRLIKGPYRMPACEVGSILTDRVRGRVIVGGITTAPIPWPWSLHHHGAGIRVPILTGDLVKAVRTESNQAVAYHWGVSRWTVARWRRALGLGRMTPGTLARWRELRPQRLTLAAQQRGGKNRHRILPTAH